MFSYLEAYGCNIRTIGQGASARPRLASLRCLCRLAYSGVLAQLLTLGSANAHPPPIHASCWASASSAGPFSATAPITLTQGQDLFLRIDTNNHDSGAPAVYTANFAATINTTFSFGPARVIYTKARQGGSGLATGGAEDVILNTGNRPTGTRQVTVTITSDQPGTSVQNCNFPFTLTADPAFPDRDGDGLLDNWEQNGFDADMDGTIDVDLPTLGANPAHKDLFLELDWIPNVEPRQLSVQLVKEAFARAPVNAGGTANPDGQPGITLHVDTGSLKDSTGSEDMAGANTCGDFLDNGADGQADFFDSDCLVGDNYNGGGQISQPPTGLCGVDNASPTGGTSAFYLAKSQAFNPNRSAIFRYGIFALGCDLNNDGRIDRGGQAEKGGNDLVILRSFGSGAVGGPLNEGAALMHEFGHTLSLGHGGFEPHNCKPNYVSVMNYQHSGFGIRTAPGNGVQHPMFGSFLVDFSPPRFPTGRGAAPLANLIESNLDETSILDATDAFNSFVYSGAGRTDLTRSEDNAGPNTCNDTLDNGADGQADGSDPDCAVGQLFQNRLDQLVDWNRNNALGDVGVAADIDRDSNGFPTECDANRVISGVTAPLVGHDDWTKISLPFRDFGDSADAPINPVTFDLTFDEAVALEQQLNTTDLAVSLSAAPDPVAAGSQLVYSLTVSNRGPNPSAQVRVSLVLPSSVTYLSDTGGCLQAPAGTLTCALGQMLPGANRQISVTARVPADLLNATGGPQGISASAQVTNLAGGDSNPGNDTSNATTTVISQADLDIGKSCAPSSVLPGENVTCTLSLANAGPSDARTVTITDDLAENLGVIIVTASGGGFACTSNDANVPEITCSKGIQPAGTSSIVTYTLRVLDDAPPESTFTNTTAVQSAAADPQPGNNADTAVIATPTCTIDQRNASSGQTIRGTLGADVICGSAHSDSIRGLGGDDVIFALAGDDDISGGDGADAIFGGRGDDEIKADDGDDHLFGNKGDDEVLGGRGNDVLSGGAGDDELRGNRGDDVLSGDAGDDELRGDDGSDDLSGGAGDDELEGDGGDDVLKGDRGYDDCDGGQGQDSAATCEGVTMVP